MSAKTMLQTTIFVARPQPARSRLHQELGQAEAQPSPERDAPRRERPVPQEQKG